MTHLLDVLLIACVALVAVGAGLIYLPAGLIVGGLLGGGAVLLLAGLVSLAGPAGGDGA